MSVRTSVITGAGVGAMSSGGCGGGVETDSGGGVGGGGGGGVLSLDISFEGPGHYGLEANKMTTSLIKVTILVAYRLCLLSTLLPSISLVFIAPPQ